MDLDGRERRPSPGQAAACAIVGAHACALGAALGRRARVLATRYFGGGVALPGDGTRGNAFQHAVWNALMAIHLGAGRALVISTGNEGRRGNPSDHRAMDLRNNATGATVGASTRLLGRNAYVREAMAINAVLRLARAGRLRSIR